MITDERMEKALRYLSTTDEPAALAKTEVERISYLARRVRARMFLQVEGKSIEERKARAEVSEEVDAVDAQLVEAIAEDERYRARRKTAELIVETWRSILSARKQGMNI